MHILESLLSILEKSADKACMMMMMMMMIYIYIYIIGRIVQSKCM